MSKSDLSAEDAAARLAVPAHEVIETRPAPAKDGHLATTHDGVVYHLGEETVSYYANYPPDTFYPVYVPAPSSKAEERAEEDTRGAVEAPEPDAEPVPEGAAGKVLAWVNRDQARAARALAEERKRPEGEQRAGLVEQLSKLASP